MIREFESRGFVVFIVVAVVATMIRRYLFLTERFEIRFEVINQLIEQKLTRGGKKKKKKKKPVLSIERLLPVRCFLHAR